MEVMERVRERAWEKEVSVEILMGSLKVEERRRRGEGARSGEGWGERVGEPPVEKRLVAVGGLLEAMVARSGSLESECRMDRRVRGEGE